MRGSENAGIVRVSYLCAVKPLSPPQQISRPEPLDLGGLLRRLFRLGPQRMYVGQLALCMSRQRPFINGVQTGNVYFFIFQLTQWSDAYDRSKKVVDRHGRFWWQIRTRETNQPETRWRAVG